MNGTKIVKVVINDYDFKVTYKNTDIKEYKNNNTYTVGDYIAYVRNNKLCCGDIYSIHHPNTKNILGKVILNDKSRLEFMVNNKLKDCSYAVNPINERIIKISSEFYEEYLNILTKLEII